MRIISLNASCGENLEALLAFIAKEAAATDIFCLQEMMFGGIPGFTKENHARINLYTEVGKRLQAFRGFKCFAPEYALHYKYEPLPAGVRPGLATY